MNYIKIIDAKKYIPKKEILNGEIETKFGLKTGYLKRITGIEKRYYSEIAIEEMALEAVKKLGNNILDVDMIIVATTSSNKIMPGISNYIQKELQINSCICMDILVGCGGFINAIDIVSTYIETGKIKKAIVVGVDLLSKIIDEKDLGTTAVLSDGAGAILIESTEKRKKYFSNIESTSDEKDILTYEIGKNQNHIYMNGKEVYKYAVTKTVENVKGLLNMANEDISNIKYIIPHQSNLKIMKGIASRLNIDINKLYINIENVGNTFCASIPIAMADMKERGLLNSKDKVILLGYGGGLNTGSILIEV